MPTRNPDRWARDQHTWPGDITIVNRIAQSDITKRACTDVSYGGKPCHQCLLGMHDAQDRPPLVGKLETLIPVVAATRSQMHMHIDQTG